MTSADLWAFGITIYTMVYGITPFEAVGCDTKEEFKLMTMGNIVEQDLHFPSRQVCPLKCRLFIKGLLTKKPKKRTGANMKFRALMDNLWFAHIKWQDLEAQTIRPPHIPPEHKPEMQPPSSSSPASGAGARRRRSKT